MIRMRSDCRHETSRQSPIWEYAAVMTSSDPIPHAIPRRRPDRIADAVDTALRRNLPKPGHGRDARLTLPATHGGTGYASREQHGARMNETALLLCDLQNDFVRARVVRDGNIQAD